MRRYLRFMMVWLSGIASILLTGFFIDKIKNLLLGFRIYVPDIIYIGVLFGSLGCVGIWVLGWFSRELERFRNSKPEREPLRD